MKRQIITRVEAIKKGLNRYFTARRCPYGHVAERSIYSGCVECNRLRMLEVERDHRPIDIKIDVKKLRTELGMSQPQFAEAFGFGLRTVRNWEQGHRYPMSTARVLLYLVSCAPRQAMRHLAEMRK